MRILFISLSTVCFCVAALNLIIHDVFSYDPIQAIMFWAGLGVCFAIGAALVRRQDRGNDDDSGR